MKKIYILLISVVLTTSSCEDFLNTEPTMKVSLEQYYNEEGGVDRALTGVYDSFGALYGSSFIRTMDMSDESFHGRSGEQSGLVINNFSSNDGTLLGTWSTLYTGINRANDLIAHIDVPVMDDAKRKVILGEALFLRGYFYFMLASRWGDVPVRLTPTTSPIGLQLAKTPQAQVYEQVLKDMKAAEGMVAANKYAHSGRVSKTVVQGILSRVYLYMAGYPLNDTSKYADALAYAKKVIDSGERGLKVDFNPNPTLWMPISGDPLGPNNAYQQIFINMAGKEEHDTRESLWEAEFKGNGTDSYFERGTVGNHHTGIPYTSGTSAMGYSYSYPKSTYRLFTMYDQTGKDLRRNWVFATYTLTDATGGGIKRTNFALPTATPTPPPTSGAAFTNEANKIGKTIAKWRREYELPFSKDRNNTAINFPILRYADILLMYAEAKNYIDGPTVVGSGPFSAEEAVNQVRRRAYGLPIGTPSPAIMGGADAPVAATLDKASFQQFIEDERMRELCFEGMRRMDLIRWNKYLTNMWLVRDEFDKYGPSNPSNAYGRNVFANASEKNLLFPIPLLEATLNP